MRLSVIPALWTIWEVEIGKIVLCAVLQFIAGISHSNGYASVLVHPLN